MSLLPIDGARRLDIVRQFIDVAIRICRLPVASAESRRPNELASELNQVLRAMNGIGNPPFLTATDWEKAVDDLEAAVRPFLSLPANHPRTFDYIEATHAPFKRMNKILDRLEFDATWNEPAADTTGKGKPAKRTDRPRGAPDQGKAAADSRLLADWQAAKNAGATRESFCRGRGIEVKDLIDAQDRQRSNKRRAAD